MKKLVLLLLVMAVPAMALSLQNPAVSVSLMSYEPFPAHPGTMEDVWLKVENGGSAALVNVSIEPAFGYEVAKGSWDVGTLPSGYYRILHGRIALSENAPEGELPVKISYVVNGIKITRTEYIHVQSSPKFRTSSFTSHAKAGSYSRINVTISVEKNSADNVYVSFLSSDFLITGKHSFYLGEMKSGENRTVRLTVYPRAEKAGTIQMVVSYTYGSGTQGMYNDSLGIAIDEHPEIIASATQEAGKLKVKVVNAGYGTADFLRMECNAEPSENYIGDLNSDDFDTFEITPLGRDVRCKAIYMDDGEQKEKDFQFSYHEESSSGYAWLPYAIGVLAIGLCIYLVKKR